MNRKNLIMEFKSENINMHNIVFIILTYFNKPYDYLFDKCRRTEFVLVRQFCHYFGQKYVIDTLENIGSIGGGKNHATVLHSIRAMNNYIETKHKPIINDFELIEKEIQMFIKLGNTVIFRDVSGIEQPEINLIEILKAI